MSSDNVEVVVDQTNIEVTHVGGSNIQVTNPAPLNIDIALAGIAGATGPANVLAIGTVTTGAAGSSADADITGTSPSQILDLTIPRGDKGETGNTGATGPANVLTVGTVTQLSPVATPTIDITGVSPSQMVDFGIPAGAKILNGTATPDAGTGLQGDWFLDTVTSDLYEKTGISTWTLRANIKGNTGDTGNTGATGPANQLSVDSVTASAPGSTPVVTIGGAAPSQTISFVLPRGDVGPVGPAPNLAIGTTTTVAPGGSATATVTGTNPNYVLNIGIPQGDKGDIGAQWITGNAAPTSGIGVEGDFYLVTGLTGLGDVYEKTDATTWTLQGNIRGAAGNGSVNAVNSVLPDVNGNVLLTWSDFSGIIPASALPSMATTETYTVADEAAMLALAAQRGDLALRTDLDETFILAGDDPAILANWTALLTDGGNVRLTGDQTIGGIKTFSVAPVVPNASWSIASTSGLQAELDLKAPLASPTFTGTVSGITAAMVGLGNVVNLAQVDLINAQTIGGVKTFTDIPVVPINSWTIANTSGLQGALDGKAASSHNHDAGAVTTGTFAIARIPTGTTGTTVALGDHLHTGVYEPVIAAGTISQYRRGDNTWRDLGLDAVLLTGNQSIAGSKTFTSGAEFTSSVLTAAGLTNASIRPAVGAGRIDGEISGRGSSSASDDGFLRLSAGGGTSAVKSYIDISGHSTVTDMNRNIVFGTENVERLRIKSTEITSTIPIRATTFISDTARAMTVTHAANAADGIVLTNTTLTNGFSPRIFWQNDTGSNVIMRSTTNLIITTGAVPGSSSGTARITIADTGDVTFANSIDVSGNVAVGAGAVTAAQLSNTTTNTIAVGTGSGVNIAGGLLWRANGAGWVANVSNAGTGTADNGLLVSTTSVASTTGLLQADSGGVNRFKVMADGAATFTGLISTQKPIIDWNGVSTSSQWQKRAYDVVTWTSTSGVETGELMFNTNLPSTLNVMITLHVKGYVHATGQGVIDLIIKGYYTASGTMNTIQVLNNGTFPIDFVRFYNKTATGTLSISIDTPNADWDWAKVWVDGYFGHSTLVTDAQLDGWTSAIVATPTSSGYTSITSASPSDSVRADTTQTISGAKTFSSLITGTAGVSTGGVLTVPGTSYQTFGAVGVGPPSFTTRSAGTKIVLYSGAGELGASSAEYAIGIDGSTLWNSLPTTSATSYFKWFGGTTNVMQLTGSGNLWTNGTITSVGQGTFSGGINNTPWMELGSQTGSGTPFIDFHSGATLVDFDARIIASGGTGANASGALDIEAATFKVNATTYLTRRVITQYNASSNLAYNNANIEIQGTSSAPRLSFHHTGLVASQISIESSGAIAIRNNPGTGYEHLKAGNITADRAIFEKALSASGTTGTVTLDASAGSVFYVSPTGNITTLSITNVPSGTSTAVTVTLCVDGTAGTPSTATIAGPAGAIWMGANPTPVSGKARVYTFMSTNGGASWYSSGAVQA